MTSGTRHRSAEGPAPAPEFQVRIEKVVYGGDGLGRAQGKVVFVPFSVPGDLLRVRAVERKKNFLRAAIVAVLEPGPGRQQPPCPYFGVCGGCQWQQLEYARQVETKRQILEETVRHHFPATRNLLIPMKASPADYHYRSRARLQIRGSEAPRTVGFFKFRSHDVEDIRSCPLLQPTLNEALAAVRTRAQDPGPAPQEVDIACSEENRRWHSAACDLPAGEGSSGRDGAAAPTPPLLRRTVGEFAYAVAPGVFFQANDFTIADLTGTVAGLAQGRGNRAALDLYCGAGLLSLPLARLFESVTAVESSPEASALCSYNAEAAGLRDVRVVCAEVERWMAAVGSVSPPGFDLVVLDPPRAGAGIEVMARIREWAPETIVYVSCDPQTMCRDLAALPEQNYTIDEVLGIDFFPQTYHFESIVRLARR